MLAAQSVFEILTVVTSVILRVSPFPDYYRIIKHKAPGEVQLLPVVALFVNSAALVMYACVIDDYVPLFTTNMFGVCTGIGFAIIFFKYALDRVYVYKMCGYGLLVTAILLLYTTLGAAGVTGETRDHEGTVLGWITIFTTVTQFGAPLATMKRVIVTKSNASLPFFMCLMNVINCSCWVTYSSLKWNPFILAPSIAGTLMGVTQVALWVTYRRQPAGEATQKKALNGPPREALVCDSIVIETPLDTSALPSRGSTSDCMFNEVTTPRMNDTVARR